MLLIDETTPETESFDETVARLTNTNTELVEKIQHLCAPLELHVSLWRGHYQIPKADVVLNDVKLKHNVKPPHWDLRPPKLAAKAQVLETQAWRLVDAFAVPSKRGRGVRLVRADRLDHCLAGLEDVKSKIRSIGSEVSSEEGYQEIVKYVEDSSDSDEAFRLAMKCLPNRNALRNAYDLEWTVMPTAVPNWAKNSDSFHARELQKAERKIAANDLVTFLKAPRQQLAEAATTLIEQLEVPAPKRRIRMPSVEAIMREVEHFGVFLDYADPTLHKRCAETKALIAGLMVFDAPAKKLSNDDSIAERLAISLSDLREAAESQSGLLESLRMISR